MNSLALSLLADARAFLADYLSKLERCLDALDEESVWWRANPESNSIGNLMLHLDGSTRMWVLGVAAGQRVVRDRDAEFSERGPLAKAQLLARLRATMAEVDGALGRMDESALMQRRESSARGEVTALWAVLHAVEHFAMHTGQIILITKLRSASAIRLSS
jgi:uncharacterized damage-inducible protein DinB